MKLAIIGSRKIKNIDIGKYISDEVTEIVSGGAVGVDTCAAEYAIAHGIKLVEFLPQYEIYGRAAPIYRNKKIVDYADAVLAFWDGSSKGTRSVISYAKKIDKDCQIVLI